jgi:hypothetical protein
VEVVNELYKTENDKVPSLNGRNTHHIYVLLNPSLRMIQCSEECILNFEPHIEQHSEEDNKIFHGRSALMKEVVDKRGEIFSKKVDI